MSAPREPDPQTRASQIRAADPNHSAWVSANAGSGKTYVLASRVIRLLLGGVAPSRILCLTFTKAAAANMAARVFDTLARWAVADDDALRAELARHDVERHVGLDIARKLFARALETPGGLKIQTIHAFCERVLHIFPFEANVAADFRVVEEAEQAELLALAQREALSELAGHDALARVAEGTWDGGFVQLVAEMRAHRRTRGTTSLQNREAALRDALGLRADDTETSVARVILDGGIAQPEWAGLANRCDAGSKDDTERGLQLRQAAGQSGSAAVDAYFDVFFTQKGDLRKRIITSKLATADPDLAARLDGEAARVAPLLDRWRAARILARTQALEIVTGAVIGHYERFKQARALLDFDDLITRTDDLLAHPHASQWVMFKLDGGIEHILVDEAQDTSEPQWRILEALAREFTAGEGRVRAHRTFFAVGDEKQSIFSFQGAAPAKFDAMRRGFAGRAAASNAGFADVRLHSSFRSSQTILDGVDAVFDDAARRRGLSADAVAPRHLAIKENLPGLIELWPPVGPDPVEPPDTWLLPVDATSENEPPVRLAHKVATKITHLLDPARHEAVEAAVPGQWRPVRPGDIMVLVRRRDAFFEAVIRALKDKAVHVAGADRLDVVGHIAVMDCAAAGRVALLPDDDLALATVLKSPFLGLDDDDLLRIAPRRTTSLHEALSRSPEPRHRAAALRIAGWRARIGSAPYEFFAHILGAEGGRRALLARLGPEANDALDEFLGLALAQERTGAPSLLAFLTSLEALKLEVKRDLESAGDAVRVMTVHAAKGLEAKIVFLPDTCAAPSGNHDPLTYALPNGAVAWSAGKSNDPQALGAARAAVRIAQEDEYRRLLYVAMTRAEERLYIAGYHGVRAPRADSWHAMMAAALRPISEPLIDPLEEGGELLRFGSVSKCEMPASKEAGANPTAIPAWLGTPAPPEAVAAPPLRPSSALAGADPRNRDERPVATSALQRGLAVHALLRRLADVPAPQRPEGARALLASAFPDLAALHDTVAAEALAVLALPELAPLFGPHSLAEVGFSADLSRENRTPVRIAGQVDRLAELGEEILVADFKTGAAPSQATRAKHVPQIALYVAALRKIYAGRPVRALLVYTDGPQVVRLEEAGLARALEAALATAP